MVEECPCCMPPCVVKFAPPGKTHQKITDGGVQVWVGDHGPYIPGSEGIQTIDSSPFVYVNKPASTFDSNTLRKVDSATGETLWSKKLPSNILAVAPSGNILVATFAAGPSTTRRLFNAAGTSVWTLTTTTQSDVGAAFTATDEIYTIYNGIGTSDLTYISAAGTILAGPTTVGVNWGSARSLSYGAGIVLTGHNRGANNLTTRAADPAGIGSSTIFWTADHGANVLGVAMMPNGGAVTVGVRTAGSKTTRCYDSSGTLLWSADHGAQVNCVAVDSSNNIYTGGNRTGSLTTRKYDSSGALVWSFDYGTTVFGICVDNAGGVYQCGSRITA